MFSPNKHYTCAQKEWIVVSQNHLVSLQKKKKNWNVCNFLKTKISCVCSFCCNQLTIADNFVLLLITKRQTQLISRYKFKLLFLGTKSMSENMHSSCSTCIALATDPSYQQTPPTNKHTYCPIMVEVLLRLKTRHEGANCESP